MNEGNVKIVAVGDVQPNREEPETLFKKVLPTLEWGDLRYCQLECQISDRGVLRTDVQNPAHRVPPKNIKALTSAGFNVVSYAGNNNMDYGENALYDTLNALSENGIEYLGVGKNLEEARAPLYTNVNGVRVAWVNFCSILREGFDATPDRAGISPLKVRTFYEPLENIYEQPGTPARTVTVPNHDDFENAMAIVREARENADIVIGCFHWGVHFTHDLSIYQAEVGYAAIDNGCDLILGTHPHCLQAVDVYKGKYIFYSLGNFAFEQPESIAQKGVGKYLSLYGIPLEKELKTHPHPSHCRNTILLKIDIKNKQINNIKLIPVYFNDNAEPEVQEPGTEKFEEIITLMEKLCDEIGTKVIRDDDGAVVSLEKTQPIDTRALLNGRIDSYPWLRNLTE
jgi:hypothetical protein